MPVLRRGGGPGGHLVTTALFIGLRPGWRAGLAHPARVTFLLLWLCGAILLRPRAVARHAERVAVKLGEPLGTLVLTLSVIGIEVMMIGAVMSTGQGNSALARDAMFAVVMIVLNGMVGLSLLLGGLRYHEQTYNLQGANAFLAVIVPLAVLGLVLPNLTGSSPGPTFSPLQSTFLIVMSVVLYGVFLAIQTLRHRDYFVAPNLPDAAKGGDNEVPVDHEVRSVAYHTTMLLACVLPLVILSKQIAVPINYAIHALHAPPALGGFLVSVLILSPESLGATRAALANQLQRSVNI